MRLVFRSLLAASLPTGPLWGIAYGEQPAGEIIEGRIGREPVLACQQLRRDILAGALPMTVKFNGHSTELIGGRDNLQLVNRFLAAKTARIALLRQLLGQLRLGWTAHLLFPFLMPHPAYHPAAHA